MPDVLESPSPVTDTEAQSQGQDQQDESADTENLGEWNEKLDEKYQRTLIELAKTFCDEFRYPRRLEVMKAWQARNFWRELQHLNWNWDGQCWDVLGPAGVDQSSGTPAGGDSAVLYSTNLYQGFGDAFIAVVTQAVPSLRFEPEDPKEAADIQTAQASEGFRKYIQHENDPIKLMTKAAVIAWTDGRMHGWTRWEVDKRTGQPREKQNIYGSMEVKVPVIYDDQDEYPYLQFSTEYHLSTVRAKVKGRAFEDKDYYKKITAGSGGNGQDTYERTARISVMQGISMKSAGGDAYSHLCTTQRTWMRPTVFMDDKVPEDQRDYLQGIFPDGCYLEVDNTVYTGSRNSNMDDEWAVENIMEGNGAFRNSKGTCLISVQERFNDVINCTQDVYEKTQPVKHFDNKLWDVDGMRRQASTPGAVNGVDMQELQAGDSLENHTLFEPQATVSGDMLEYAKELLTSVPEFLTGLSSVLFGTDLSGDKSGKALSIQQNAAMGRTGLPFRVLKRLYARMMEQAVRCAARNRTEDATVGIPDENGQIDTITMRIEDLKGNIRCFPDSDENFPESWTQKRAIFLQLMEMAGADPVLKAILSSPENQNLAKRLIGIQEMSIPEAASWNKQMVEISYLLKTPAPPPVEQPPKQIPNPLQPETMETVQPPPVQTSSIPIDPVYDNNQAEFLTVVIWINSSKGQKIKQSNPMGFENVRLHGLEHKQALLAAMAPQGGAPPQVGAAPPTAPAPPQAPPQQVAA